MCSTVAALFIASFVTGQAPNGTISNNSTLFIGMPYI